MWPFTSLAWYRRIDGHHAGRVFHKVLFYVGILIASLAFFAIYYEQSDGDGGTRRKSPVPDGPLTVPRDWLDKVRA